MKPFPDSWTGSPDTEAGYPPRQRTWQASLARWALIVLTIAGVAAFAAKAIPNCAAIMPGAEAATIQDTMTTHQSAPATEAANKVWWFWVAKQGEHFGAPIKQGGCEAEGCQSFGLGVSIESLSWFSSQGTGRFEGPLFELQTFRERDCVRSTGDKKYTKDAEDVSAKFLSWKVVKLFKD